MTVPRYVGFNEQALHFLQELKANNNRDWFKENKSRYEELVLDSALRFIQSMQYPLADFAPHFTAMPSRVGGSLMRVYRDTRFSKIKLPYKTRIRTPDHPDPDGTRVGPTASNAGDHGN